MRVQHLPIQPRKIRLVACAAASHCADRTSLALPRAAVTCKPQRASATAPATHPATGPLPAKYTSAAAWMSHAMHAASEPAHVCASCLHLLGLTDAGHHCLQHATPSNMNHHGCTFWSSIIVTWHPSNFGTCQCVPFCVLLLGLTNKPSDVLSSSCLLAV